MKIIKKLLKYTAIFVLSLMTYLLIVTLLSFVSVNEDFAELIHDNITRTTYANDTSNYNPDSEFLSDIVLQYNPGTDTYTIAGSDL